MNNVLAILDCDKYKLVTNTTPATQNRNMKMANVLFEQFRAFVYAQPRDKAIDHTMHETLSAWGNCAIGEFYQAITPKEDQHAPLTPFAHLVCKGKAKLVVMLGCSKVHTYGQLASYIRKNYRIPKNLPLFEQFKLFVASQPQDKEINHSSWKTCAIGEFARSKGLEPYCVSDDVFKGLNFPMRELRNPVGNGVDLKGNPITTYGQLSAMLTPFHSV